ncbi:MAG: hypothetical protein GXO19_05695 [Epsilonproteobacteria bacterium]|nr:hypothetical protein [Campylobacterota bacterium]NPA57209.1 hypothetical protein [Campylobacterota bacterium]
MFGDLFFLYGLRDSPKNLPETYRTNIELWRSRAPQFRFRYKFQTLPQLQGKLIAYDPSYEKFIRAFRRGGEYEWILNCDFARYVYIYHEGMSYSDLDIFPRRNISGIFETMPTKSVIFVIENIVDLPFITSIAQTPIRGGRAEFPYRVANFLIFARKAYHPIFAHIIAKVESRLHQIGSTMDDYGVIYTTGPDAVTEAVFENIGKYDDIGFIQYEIFKKNFIMQNLGSWRQKPLSHHSQSREGR